MIEHARVFPDLDALSRAAAEESLRIIEAAASEKGRALVCLTGGHSPVKLYSLWASEFRDRMPWRQIHFFWGDERYVPHDDPASNYRMAYETLLSHIHVPPANIHPMPTASPRPEESAAGYEATLKKYFATGPPVFDLLLLGMGNEGHVASLFPDSAALEETSRWVVAAEVPATPPRRLTLTLPVLNSALDVFFLVPGAEKRPVIEALKKEPRGEKSAFPAGRVRPAGRLTWFLDQAAAG